MFDLIANMAAARVFAIPELVEAILLRLPTRDLLFSKRICGTCRDTHDSSKIKRALFLLPGTALDTSDEASFPQPDYSASGKSVKTWWNWSDYAVPLTEAASHGVSFNPLLVDHFTGPKLMMPSGREKSFNTVRLRVLQHREDASFCRMFITQPPLWMMTVHANKRRHYVNGAGEDMVILSRMIGGVTYGNLLDEMEMVLREPGRTRGRNGESLYEWDVGVRGVPKDEGVEEALKAVTV